MALGQRSAPARGHNVGPIGGGGGVEHPDHRHRRLLRTCRERPRRRATQQCNELAAMLLIQLHPIPQQRREPEHQDTDLAGMSQEVTERF